MNRELVARVGMTALKLGVKVRTVWLSWLFGVACGMWVAVAWTYTLAFATPQAIALLEWVQG